MKFFFKLNLYRGNICSRFDNAAVNFSSKERVKTFAYVLESTFQVSRGVLAYTGRFYIEGVLSKSPVYFSFHLRNFALRLARMPAFS